MSTAVWLAVVAGSALVLVELGRSVPAWLRVRRLWTAAGVSPTATGVLAGSATGWMAVAVLTSSWPALVATVVWLFFHLLLCAELRDVDRMTYRRVVTAAGWTQLAVVLVAGIGVLLGRPADVLGLAIGAATIAHTLPALFTGMTSASTAGLSVPALLVNSVEGMAYLAGGVGLGGVAPVGQVVLGYVLSGGALVLGNLPRLIRVMLRRSQGLDGVAPRMI